MSEWKEYKLEDLLLLHDSKRKPLSSIERAKRQGLYPYYGAASIVDYIDDYIFEGDYILLGEDGTVMTEKGTPILQRPSGKFWVSNHAHVLTNSRFVTFEFLYYLLSNTNITPAVTGAVQLKISQKNLFNIPVTIPVSIENQKQIASILASLDNKIAVNKKICENLEAQAQALFKHWFVDFAPFKDGKFIESELGLIPEEWRVGKFEDIAELRKPSIKPQDNIFYTHYSIPAFENSKNPSIDEGSTIKSNKFEINDGAVLLSKLNPSTKRIWYTGNVPENSVSSTEFLPFYSKNKEFTPFIYCYLNCDSNYREIANGAKGTTNSHQRIDANSILNRALAYSQEAIREFCDCCQYMMQLILEANQESSRLATLRDTLLPKLMSGQIKV